MARVLGQAYVYGGNEAREKHMIALFDACLEHAVCFCWRIRPLCAFGGLLLERAMFVPPLPCIVRTALS